MTEQLKPKQECDFSRSEDIFYQAEPVLHRPSSSEVECWEEWTARERTHPMAFIFFSGQCVSNVVLRVLCCTALQEECQNFMDRFVEKKQKIQYVYQKGGFKIEFHNDQFVTAPIFNYKFAPTIWETQDWGSKSHCHPLNEVLFNLKCRKIATWKMHHFKN